MRARSIPLFGLISAEFLSLVGNQIAAVALPVLILEYTHSPFVTGLAGIGNMIPIVLAAFVGGKAIDRFGAWYVSIIADLLSGLSVLALPIVFLSFTPISPLVIFLLVMLGALFDPSGISSRQTLVPSLARLANKPLHKINAIRGGLENGADFLGPIIGVAIISAIGTAPTFFVNAASFFLCVLIFLATIPKRRPRPSGMTKTSLLPGIRFIFSHTQLRSLALVGMLASFVILPFLALLLPLLTTQKYASPSLLGISFSVFGAAATLGALAFSRLSQLFSRTVIYYMGLLITALSLILCALVKTPVELIGSVALAGSLLGAGNPLEQTILHEEAPKTIAGQVFTSLAAIRYLAGPFGLLLAGILAEFFPVDFLLLGGGGILGLAALAGWFWLPLRRQPQAAGESTK